MPRLRCWLALTLMILVSGVAASQDNLNKILKRFPGYHVVTTRELDSYAKTYFLQHFPSGRPGVVMADFDGNGYSDYALLLISDLSKAMKFVVLLCGANEQCTPAPLCGADEHCTVAQEMDLGTDYDGIVYLRPVKTGSRAAQTEALETPGPIPSVRLSHTGDSGGLF